MLFIGQHRVEIFPQARRRFGRGHGVEGGGSLLERGKFPLTISAAGEVGARLGRDRGTGAGVEQVGEGVAGALAGHGEK